jgi:hypothetical protein
MALVVRNLAQIRNGSASPQQLFEALSDIIKGHDTIAQQTNAAPNGITAAPPAVNNLTVAAQDGIFHAQITDNGQVYRGVNYHLQYSTNQSFSAPVTVHLGPSRDYRAQLGNQNLYWRAFSDYPTSGPSSPVYHGGATPLVVSGGGSASGPSIPAGQGSGTGDPGQISGHGPIPYRTKTGQAPKRQ